jgi:hypothetical protein
MRQFGTFCRGLKRRFVRIPNDFCFHSERIKVSRFDGIRPFLEPWLPMTRRPIRTLLVGAFLMASLVIALGPASAQTKKPEPAKTTAPAKTSTPAKTQQQAPAAESPAQPIQLGSFGSWAVYASDTANGRVCYALAMPKDRQPAGLTRDQAYLFVSSRPQENVRDEISFVLGFPPKEGADAQLVVGKTTYVVSTKAQGNAWLKSPKDDSAAIELMKKVPQIQLKVTSKRGNALTDIYVTAGLAQALDQVKKACP